MDTQVKRRAFDKEKLFIPIADVLSALAHPIRLKILSLLSEEEHCVCEIAEILKLPQPLISQHLAILRSNGLLRVQKKRNRKYYSLSDKRITKLLNILEEIVSQRFKEYLP